MIDVLWVFRFVLPLLLAFFSAKSVLFSGKKNFYFLFLFLLLPSIDAYLWVFAKHPIEIQGLFFLGVQDNFSEWFVIRPDANTFKNMFFISILQGISLFSARSKIYPIFMINWFTLLLFSSHSIWMSILIFAGSGLFLLRHFFQITNETESVRAAEELWRLVLSVGFMVFLAALSYRDGSFDNQFTIFLLLCSVLYSFPWITKKDNSSFLHYSSVEWWSIQQWHRLFIPLYFGSRVIQESQNSLEIFGIVFLTMLFFVALVRMIWTGSPERQFDYLSRSSVIVVCMMIFSTKTENYILFVFSFSAVMLWIKLFSEINVTSLKKEENVTTKIVGFGFLLLWIMSGFPGTMASTTIYEVFENKMDDKVWLSVFLTTFAFFVLISVKVIWSYLEKYSRNFFACTRWFWAASFVLFLTCLSLFFTGVWSGGMLPGEKDRVFSSMFLWAKTLPFQKVWLEDHYTFFVGTIASFYLFLSLLSYFLWMPDSPMQKKIVNNNPFRPLSWFRFFRRTISWSQVYVFFCWIQKNEDRFFMNQQNESKLFGYFKRTIYQTSKTISWLEQVAARGWRVQKEFYYLGLEKVSDKKSASSLIAYFVFSLIALFIIIFWLWRGLV